MSVLQRCGGAQISDPRLRRVWSVLLAVTAMLFFSCAALADPTGFDELHHTAWSLNQGAPPGIAAIAQTPDGYLWLGGTTGLYRFDGVRFEPVAVDPSDRPHSDHVFSLLVTNSGELWVGFRLGGAAVLRHGALRPLALDGSAAGVAQFVQDHSGAIWIRREQTQHELLRYKNGKSEIIDSNWGLEGQVVETLFLASDGVLWLASDTSLQFLRPGAHRFEHTGARIDGDTAALFEDKLGKVWLVDEFGARRLPDYPHGEAATTLPATAKDDSFRPFTFLVANDGTSWGTDGSHGVFRFDPARTVSAPVKRAMMESFGVSDGLTDEAASALFQDREGNIWVGTLNGLDQFRPKSITVNNQLSAPPGSYFSTAVDDEGTVYVSSMSGTFSIRPHGEPQPILLDVKYPLDICKSNKSGIWTITEHEVVRWRNGIELQYPPTGAGMADLGGCAEDTNGNFWNSAGPFGLQTLRNGGWTQVDSAGVDPAGGRFSNLEPDQQGGVSFLLSSRGILSLRDGHITVMASFGDLGIGIIHGLSRQGRDLLASGQYGLARIRGGVVKSLRSDRYSWLRGTLGLVETQRGETWIVSSAGLFSLPTTELDAALDSPGRNLKPRRFDSEDGLPAWTGRFGSEHVAVAGGDGRIWIDAGEHIISVDPAHLPHNSLPPPVNITSITADGRQYMADEAINLPQGISNLQVSYTALSLTIPERVQFKYRLIGYDRDWVEAGGRREAFYTNLPPGKYRFHVIAANNDGIWNDQGATLGFEIPPTFLQSRLFLALCVLAFLLASWTIYALRLRQISERIRGRLEERLAERERIARELHDTILQGFHGLLLQFQAAAERMPQGESERNQIEQELDRAEDVLVEGRRRVQGLRGDSECTELAKLLRQEGEAARFGTTLSTRVVVHGAPRKLHPLVQEELARIGQEAVRNVSQHARATELEVGIEYHHRGLRVSFTDDGIGIDPAILARGGAEGHFGLPGMAERARRIKGKLEVSSQPGSGARIQIDIPAGTAFCAAPARHRLWSLRFQRWEAL